MYVLPVAGEAAAAKTALAIKIDGSAVASRRCGPTCYTAPVSLAGGESIAVAVGGRYQAVFKLPMLPAPEGTALMQSVQQAMHRLSTYRIDETLGPASAPLKTTYAFQGPRSTQLSAVNRGQTVIIGSVRYSRSKPNGAWLAEATLPVKVPEFAWDSAAVQDARIVDVSTPSGEEVVSFFESLYGIPVWSTPPCFPRRRALRLS